MKRFFSTIFILALTAASPVYAQWGVVKVSAATAQAEPDYTSPVETQFLMGSVVRVLDRSGYWLKVRADEPFYEAWVNELVLAPVDDGEKADYEAADKYIFTALNGSITEAPAPDAPVLCGISLGGLVRIAQDDRGRAVRKGGFLGIVLPSGEPGYVKRSDVKEFSSWAETMVPSASGIVATAGQLAGTPYVWGGASSAGLDCSGLTRLVFYMNGILLPRNVSQQVKCGIEAPLDALEPGDLLFFAPRSTSEKPARPNHVAIYIGDDKFIHSSQLVRTSSLKPDGNDSYERRPVCARRILGASEADYSLRSYYFPE